MFPFPGGTSDEEPAFESRRLKRQFRFLGQEDPLEKEIATHPSTPAWKITWTEESGRLQPMGLQRVGHSNLEDAHVFPQGSRAEIPPSNVMVSGGGALGGD